MHKKLITAIASGNSMAIEQAARNESLVFEQWGCTVDGAFVNASGTLHMTEAEFINYHKANTGRKLLFLSCANLTEEQISKFTKHEK